MKSQGYYKKKYQPEYPEYEKKEIVYTHSPPKMEISKEKKTKECGFINVTDPNLRKQLIEVSKCPADATNFTFWFQKSDPTNQWGLTIKSIPKESNFSDYEKSKGMIFHSQHTWKITWYHDNDRLKIAGHSKSLAEDLTGNDYKVVTSIYMLYKAS